jgi:hypothetical protein
MRHLSPATDHHRIMRVEDLVSRHSPRPLFGVRVTDRRSPSGYPHFLGLGGLAPSTSIDESIARLASEKLNQRSKRMFISRSCFNHPLKPASDASPQMTHATSAVTTRWCSCLTWGGTIAAVEIDLVFLPQIGPRSRTSSASLNHDRSLVEVLIPRNISTGSCNCPEFVTPYLGGWNVDLFFA